MDLQEAMGGVLVWSGVGVAFFLATWANETMKARASRKRERELLVALDDLKTASRVELVRPCIELVDRC